MLSSLKIITLQEQFSSREKQRDFLYIKKADTF